MSRRKQSTPRQIKRSFGDMEAGEEAQTMDSGLTEGEATAAEPEPCGEPEPPSPSSGDTEPPPPLQPTPTSPGGPKKMEEQEPETRPQETSASAWNGPDELEPGLQEDGQQCVRARRSLTEGSSWGPFRGSVQSRASPPRQGQSSPPLTLQLEDQTCWLRTLPQATTEAEANGLIYWKEEALWCRITKPVPAGGLLSVRLSAEPQSAPTPPVKREHVEAEDQTPAHTDIQLLPQQAGMASILATAVINRDIFPCKDCGIWYRSERNLQAHLLYYCASRQSACSPAASEDKPKETYPNERVCPFPQCRKSCPSASSLEIHMRSHSGERPFVCLICLSAFTTKANCERHLKVHTDTLSGICHSCGFISTTRDILYSHLVTSHMICQPGCKGELYAPGYPAAKIPADSLASFPQHAALPGALASADLVPTRSPGLERKPLMETTNGEACAAPQNGGEPPAAPRDIKVEAEEEPEAEQASSPAPRAPSRTPSPHNLPTLRVKAERTSPSPACSPTPGELGAPAGPLFLPQFVFGADAVPQASEILAKMSELVHSRLKQGQGAPGLFPGTPAPKGATCFECEITFNNINNYYVHKRLYCSGRHQGEDVPGTRRPKGPAPAPAPAPAPHGSLQTAPSPPLAPETDAGRSPPSPDARDEEAGSGLGAQAATPEAEAVGRGSEGSQSPGSSVDDAEDDPSRTLCEACNIRFSRHETYTVHKRYYCASRHDPPPRRPPTTTANTGGQPTVRTRRRRKLYELHTAGAPPPPVSGPTHSVPAEPPVSPGPSAADGPIDLSKKPRRHGPESAPGPPPPPPPPPLPLADYHECTACRVSFHSLDAYLTHKKFSCPAAQLRGLRAPDDAPPAAAVVCPYCPPNGLVRGDLLQHLRRAHGLLVGRPPAGPGAPEARTPPASPPPRVPRDSLNGQESAEPAAGSPLPGPPASPAATPARGLSPVPAPPVPPLDQGAHTPGKGPPAPVPNGNPRYCRLCNIKFSSLSTFIAHKKYYCSSHAAEHVK